MENGKAWRWRWLLVRTVIKCEPSKWMNAFSFILVVSSVVCLDLANSIRKRATKNNWNIGNGSGDSIRTGSSRLRTKDRACISPFEFEARKSEKFIETQSTRLFTLFPQGSHNQIIIINRRFVRCTRHSRLTKCRQIRNLSSYRKIISWSINLFVQCAYLFVDSKLASVAIRCLCLSFARSHHICPTFYRWSSIEFFFSQFYNVYDFWLLFLFNVSPPAGAFVVHVCVNHFLISRTISNACTVLCADFEVVVVIIDEIRIILFLRNIVRRRSIRSPIVGFVGRLVSDDRAVIASFYGLWAMQRERRIVTTRAGRTRHTLADGTLVIDAGTRSHVSDHVWIAAALVRTFLPSISGVRLAHWLIAVERFPSARTGPTRMHVDIASSAHLVRQSSTRWLVKISNGSKITTGRAIRTVGEFLNHYQPRLACWLRCFIVSKVIHFFILFIIFGSQRNCWNAQVWLKTRFFFFLYFSFFCFLVRFLRK